MDIERPHIRIAHLLRRAGFGPTSEEIERYGELGFDEAVGELLDFEGPVLIGGLDEDEDRDGVPDVDPGADARRFKLDTPEGLRAWWLSRMIFTPRPLQEKMTLFWHGHFATAIKKVGDPLPMRRQNELFRTHALGSFRTLLREVSRDAAMLRWLDGNTNRMGRPNENYARELLELFTLGIGNYDEDDVLEAARAFTGWTVDRATSASRFVPHNHDDGPKTVLGTTGDLVGDDIVEIVLAQPAAAEHLAGCLFRFFAYDDPEPETVERFARVLWEADFEVKPVVEAIFRSPEFSSPRAYRAIVKSPTELVVGAIRQLGLATECTDLEGPLRRMGQDLFNPPNVKGWDGGLAWISTSTMLERLNWANRVCTYRGGDSTRTQLTPSILLGREGLKGPEDVVDYFLELLVDGDVPSGVWNDLIAYTDDGRPLSTGGYERVRGLVYLIMATPTYQTQ